MKTVFTGIFAFNRIRRGSALPAGLFAIAALSACMESITPAGNELAGAAAVGVPPTITQQPQRTFADVGDLALLVIGASGTGPLQYR